MNGLYRRGDSPLHRLHPLFKLVAVFPLLLLITLMTDPWTPLLLIAMHTLLLLSAGRMTPWQLLRSSLPMLTVAGGIILLYPLLADSRLTAGSPVLLSLGPIKLRQAGIMYGLATGLRLFAMFEVALIFVMTTDSSDFIRAMISQWRLSDRFGYATLAVFRFIPDLRRELDAIRAAHYVRGVSLGIRSGKGKLTERVRRLFLPLLAAAIRRAERTSFAMDARGFGTGRPRTFYRTYAAGWKDWLFLALYWSSCVLLLVMMRVMGWMGPLSWLKLLE